MVCIITMARSWQALVATRALGKAGIKVVTSDVDGFATGFFSKYSVGNFLYPNPHTNEKEFISRLIEKSKQLKKKHNEDVVILPIHNETYVISKHKKRLENHAKLCLEDHDKIMQLYNKRTLAPLLKKYRIRHPRTFLISDIKELYKIVPTLNYPAFIKIPESAASLGIYKIDDREEFIYKYAQIVRDNKLKQLPIIQEGVPGKDYCVTCLFNHGQPRAIMTYMNIKTYPYKSGTGVYRKTVKVKAMEDAVIKFFMAIKWHGVAEVDFRMGPDKTPYLIEVNPRFWGGLYQSVAANVNYPLMAHEIALKGDCEPLKKVDSRVRTENLLTSVMALMDEIKKNEPKQKKLNKLRRYWKKAFSSPEDFSKYMKLYFRTLDDYSKSRYNARIFDEFIRRRAKVKDDIFGEQDPFIFMGIFYPINLLLKYGKIDKYMLTGEKPPKK